MYKFPSTHKQIIPPIDHRYSTGARYNLPIAREIFSTSKLAGQYSGISLWNFSPTDLYNSR